MKKEKEKEPEKAEKQEMSMLRKKGFEEEKKDSDDSDEVLVSFISRKESTSCWFDSNFTVFFFLINRKSEPMPRNSPRKSCAG